MSEKSDPFTVDEVASLGSIARALDRLVFDHPAVTSLRDAALEERSKASLPTAVALDSIVEPVFGSNKEMISLGKIRSPTIDRMTPEKFERLYKGTRFYVELKPWQAAEIAAYREMKRRAEALLQMIISGRIEAHGCRVIDRAECRIPEATFCHERFYLDPTNGDIYKFEFDPAVFEGTKMVLQWDVVTLRKSAAAAQSSAASPTAATKPSLRLATAQTVVKQRKKKEAPKMELMISKILELHKSGYDFFQKDEVVLKDLGCADSRDTYYRALAKLAEQGVLIGGRYAGRKRSQFHRQMTTIDN